jgi:2-dehydro-3-deoxy-L-rhamnonate dehydrogenase (NAD+)
MDTRVDTRLKDKVAIVTGGARGIGFAAAARLAQSGAQVALWDVDGAQSSAAKISRAIGCTVEVTDPATIAAALAETERRLGPVDILIASAGITGPNAPLADYPIDAWRRVIEIDLTGVFLCCRAVVPGMVARDYGRIVTIASIAGKEGNPDAGAYSAAKGGVIALTKSLGKELAHTGVRVNCIAPAAVETGLFDQMTQKQIAYMLAKIPLGRFGTVEELAALIAWLASAECSFSTGAVFDVSGGRATY